MDAELLQLSSGRLRRRTATHLALNTCKKNHRAMLKLVAASATVATVLGAPTVPKTTERFNEVGCRSSLSPA